MKKLVKTRSRVRADEAARARKMARIAKRERSHRSAVATYAARTTLFAAVGAGVLLHGGVQEASAAPVSVVLLSAGEGEESGGSSAVDNEDDGGEESREPDDASEAEPAESEPATGAVESTPSSTPQPTGTAPTTSTPKATTTSAPEPTTKKSTSKATPEPTVAKPTTTPTQAPTTAAADPAPAAATAAPALRRAPAARPAVGKKQEADRRVLAPAGTTREHRAITADRVTRAVAQNVLTRIALGLAGVVPPSNPTTPTSPAAPAAPASALLLAQWALFRRGGTVFNQSPAASPTQAPSTTGLVTGNLNATDPDGDRLTYSVIGQPARGTVVVQPDGTFVYTPDAALARTGGTDTFTVLVRDNSPGQGRATDVLRALLGRHHTALANRLFGPHAVAVTVPVVVAAPATNTPPVVPTTPPAPTTDRGTGVVSGSLGVRDADGDPLEFTVVDQPGVGTVTVDPATGVYTFTPTAAARRVAAATPGTDTVTFTVRVSDSQGEAVSVPVTVVVDPGHAEVVAAIPVAGAQSLYASPDGRRVYALGAGGAGAPGIVAARTFAALDAPAATGSTIAIIDATSNTLISTVTLPGQPQELVFSPDGRYAFVTTRVDPYDTYRSPSTVTVIDTATDSVVGTLEAQSSHGSLYFAPDGRHAYLSDYLGDTLLVFDLDDAAVLTIPATRPQQLDFSPDGRRAYMPSITDGRTVVIDTTTHTVLGSVPGYGGTVFGPDGRYGYVVDYQHVDGSVTVIDTLDDSSVVIPLAGTRRRSSSGPGVGTPSSATAPVTGTGG
ncbi:Ig-like domain-containing protein [Actinomycetospora sp. OC33-EN08]|uniref:Ig-like domain-containing protein n=1 Tax=Actinomycetospora aurantiaca TaxID=3129233 RepID=A0ABU8MHH3_9PSEU